MRNQKIITLLIITLTLLSSSMNVLAEAYHKKTEYEIYKEAEKFSSTSPQKCLGILSNIGYAQNAYGTKQSVFYCDIMHLKALCLANANRYNEALSLLESIYKIDYSNTFSASGDCKVHYYIPRLKRDIFEIIGKYQEAIAHQNIILDSVSDTTILYRDELACKARILIKNQEYDKALDIYDSLLEDCKNNSLDVKRYQWNKVTCYSEMQEYDKAIVILDKIINTNPEGKLYFDKALILTKQNQYKKALKVYEEGIKFDPKWQYLYVGKARLLAFNYKKYKDAVNIATRFINDFKDSPTAKPLMHGIKGYSLMMMGKHKQAIDEFNIFLQSKTNCPYIWERDCIEYYNSYIWKAKCLAELGKYDEALKSVDHVIRTSSINKLAKQERETILKQKNSIWSKIVGYFKK